MSIVKGILFRSFLAAIGPCYTPMPLQSHASCYNVLRFNFHRLPSAARICVSYNKKEADLPPSYLGNRNDDSFLPLSRAVGIQQLRADCSIKNLARSLHGSHSVTTVLNSRFNPLHCHANAALFGQAYSSRAGDKQDGQWSATEGTSDNGTDVVGNDWVETLNHAWKSTVDVGTDLGNKAKGFTDEIGPYIQQLYDSHPYLESIIVPVGGTLSATLVAWFIMPKIFRKIHEYAMQSPFASLSWSSNTDSLSYEKSLWSALEDPARFLTTFMAFSQLCVIIAPTISQYLPQAWRGATVLCFVWFLYRWKTNIFHHAMASQVKLGIDREKLLTLEKISSVGLLILGVMALAEACGVAVQSILTVGGIGGVATAFAARDILGNLFSGLSVQFSRPFTVGDTIKAGSVEGQVVEMGLTTTSLINSEKFPVIVPNSLFSSQVIINISRAQWRASIQKIPVQIDDVEKVPIISEEIKNMLRSEPTVFLGKDAPYCYLSRVGSFAELTLGCNLKNMRKDELYAAEQDILLQAVKIIKQNGATLGSTRYEFNNQ